MKKTNNKGYYQGVEGREVEGVMLMIGVKIAKVKMVGVGVEEMERYVILVVVVVVVVVVVAVIVVVEKSFLIDYFLSYPFYHYYHYCGYHYDYDYDSGDCCCGCCCCCGYAVWYGFVTCFLDGFDDVLAGPMGSVQEYRRM